MAKLKLVLTYLLAIAMIGVGVSHFTSPQGFERIVPSLLPAPKLWVYLSGVFEILGGLGLLPQRTRRAAGLGLIALYVAVFPANINMAINGIQLTPDGDVPRWAMWARLPFQAVFIGWAWWVSKSDPDPKI